MSAPRHPQYGQRTEPGDPLTSGDLIPLTLLIAGVAMVLGMSFGCAGPIQTARKALEGTAEAFDAVDIAQSAPRQTAHLAAHAAAQEEPQGEQLAHYRAAMDAWHVLTRALVTGRSILLAAERAIDAWEAADNDQDWTGLAPCVLSAVANLADAVRATGVEVPELVDDALGLLRPFAGTCNPELIGDNDG